MEIRKNDVVQFTDKHKWCGCLGIVSQVKEYDEGNARYMVGVPMPQQGTAYIFTMKDSGEIERIGEAHFVVKEDET